jgi:hypothetical protein
MKTLTAQPTGSTPSVGAGHGGARAAAERHAFTRLELCAGLAALTLLGLLALPALATSQSRGHVAQCLNNLRLTGRAMQMWMFDANQTLPSWRLRVASDGGQVPNSSGNAWFEYFTLSNQLVTPRILACPADDGVRVAANFGFDPATDGYASIPYRAAATSYFINLHSSVESPAAALFGDRNLSLGPAACSLARFNNASDVTPTTRWTNRVHAVDGNLGGNIVTMDGRVAQTGTSEVQAALLRSQAEGPTAVHLLRPR